MARTSQEFAAKAAGFRESRQGATCLLSGCRLSYNGEEPAEAAEERGIRLEVVKHPGAKKGFVLLPRGWVERSFAWASRFRRVARDYERLPTTVAGLRFVAFACLFLHRAIPVLGSSPQHALGPAW